MKILIFILIISQLCFSQITTYIDTVYGVGAPWTVLINYENQNMPTIISYKNVMPFFYYERAIGLIEASDSAQCYFSNHHNPQFISTFSTNGLNIYSFYRGMNCQVNWPLSSNSNVSGSNSLLMWFLCGLVCGSLFSFGAFYNRI